MDAALRLRHERELYHAERLFKAGLATTLSGAGLIVLAGILAEQAAGVIASGETYGLEFVEQRLSGDWAALAMQKP